VSVSNLLRLIQCTVFKMLKRTVNASIFQRQPNYKKLRVQSLYNKAATVPQMCCQLCHNCLALRIISSEWWECREAYYLQVSTLT